MSADKGIWYSIKTDELLLVLASLGLKSWYGFSGNKAGTFEDVSRIIGRLWEKNVITLGSSTIRINDEYRKIFYGLAEAEECIVTKDSSNDTGEVLSYVYGDDTVVLERSRTDENELRMTLLDSGKWGTFILKECLDFESVSPVTVSDKAAPAGFQGTCKLSISDAASKEGVLTVFDKVDTASGEMVERLTVRENGTARIMTLERRNSDGIKILSGGTAETKQFLDKWII